ncbi:MAG: hypothetical protein MO847_07110 [Candidatus Protistobacter heckmanni]|nr:hypothetical protein [Candidatus Protistobacter heckmanni]
MSTVNLHFPRRAAACALALAVLAGMSAGPARAGMFDDDEARKAIIDLRDKLNAFQATASDRVEQNSRAISTCRTRSRSCATKSPSCAARTKSCRTTSPRRRNPARSTTATPTSASRSSSRRR